MKKYDELWNNINNLLSTLRSSNVVDRVNDYYVNLYNNDAPGKLIQMEMDKLQEKLDKAENSE